MNDGVSDSEVMGRNQYARHQRVSVNAVAKAIKDGRITRAVLWGPGGRVTGIRWRLADELWRQHTDPAEALKSRKTKMPDVPAAPFVERRAVHTSRQTATASSCGVVAPPANLPSEDDVALLLGNMFADSVVAWSAMAVARYEIEPETMLELMLDGILVLGVAAAERLDVDVGEFPVYLDGAMQDAEGKLPALLRQIRGLSRLIRANRPNTIQQIRELSREVAKDVETGDISKPVAGEASSDG